MFSELSHDLVHFVITYGYFAIFFITLGESMGLLLPAETALISASIYAGTTHHLNIFFVILAAILGAIIGDNIGYAIGRFGGYTLLKRYGKYVRIDEDKLKVGQYLFMIHGGKIVFFGRFISFLRAWAAFFAGVNKMEWRRFLLYNAAGGITWASFYGILGFTFGKHVHAFSMPIRYGFLSLGILYLVISTIYFRHNFRSLEKKAKNSIK